MGDKFNQICSTIDYSTYQKIENSVASIGFWTAVADIFVEQYSILNNSLEMLYTASFVAYLGLVLSNGKLHTKDINEIRTLYQQFIKNYNQMNKDFELNNPIQIYTMFNHLLYEGFLSNNKKFQFTGKESRDISTLYGTNIIMGKGVCRHISSMLKDILNDYGIDAFNLNCYNREYNVNVKITEQQKFSYAELKEWVRKHIIDEKTNQFLNAFLEEMEKKEIYGELSYKQKKEKNPIKKIIGNHVICLSRYNGEDYYLDPSQTRIYRLNLDSNALYDNEEDSDMKIKQILSIMLNSSKECTTMRSMLLNPRPSVSYEEEQELVLATKNLCKQNRDIFEQFYNDNGEIYNEISNRLIKINKNKFVTK